MRLSAARLWQLEMAPQADRTQNIGCMRIVPVRFAQMFTPYLQQRCAAAMAHRFPLDLRSGKNPPQHRRIFLPDAEAPTNSSLFRWRGPTVTRAANRQHTDFAQSF